MDHPKCPECGSTQNITAWIIFRQDSWLCKCGHWWKRESKSARAKTTNKLRRRARRAQQKKKVASRDSRYC